MQVVLDYFGCELKNVQGHVAVKHRVDSEWGSMEVNSYHNQACAEIKAPPLQIMARSDDGVIEAATYSERNIIVTIWHPERETPFRKKDIAWVRNLFERAETEKQ